MFSTAYLVSNHYSQSRERLWRGYNRSLGSGLLGHSSASGLAEHLPLLAPIVGTVLKSLEGSLLHAGISSEPLYNTPPAKNTLDILLNDSVTREITQAETQPELDSFTLPGAYPASPSVLSRQVLEEDVDVRDRIPYNSKGKWRAEAPASTPSTDTTTTEPDELTQAQLEVDASLAERLQSEENAKSGGAPRFNTLPAGGSQKSPFVALLGAFFNSGGEHPLPAMTQGRPSSTSTSSRLPALGEAGPSGTRHEPSAAADASFLASTSAAVLTQASTVPFAVVALEPTNDENDEMDSMYGVDYTIESDVFIRA